MRTVVLCLFLGFMTASTGTFVMTASTVHSVPCEPPALEGSYYVLRTSIPGSAADVVWTTGRGSGAVIIYDSDQIPQNRHAGIVVALDPPQAGLLFFNIYPGYDGNLITLRVNGETLFQCEIQLYVPADISGLSLATPSPVYLATTSPVYQCPNTQAVTCQVAQNSSNPAPVFSITTNTDILATDEPGDSDWQITRQMSLSTSGAQRVTCLAKNPKSQETIYESTSKTVQIYEVPPSGPAMIVQPFKTTVQKILGEVRVAKHTPVSVHCTAPGHDDLVKSIMISCGSHNETSNGNTVTLPLLVVNEDTHCTCDVQHVVESECPQNPPQLTSRGHLRITNKDDVSGGSSGVHPSAYYGAGGGGFIIFLLILILVGRLCGVCRAKSAAEASQRTIQLNCNLQPGQVINLPVTSRPNGTSQHPSIALSDENWTPSDSTDKDILYDRRNPSFWPYTNTASVA